MERLKPSDLRDKKQEQPQEEKQARNDYFAFTPARKFIHTGCSLLDCALGGGWVLGRIANIVGDRSTGKCAKDYYVLTSEGLLYSEDIIPEFPMGATPINWTMALDRDTDVRATHFWKEQVELTHKIETRHGIELTATPDHQVKVMLPNGDLVMKPLHCIEDGDWVVVSQGCDLFPHREVSLSEFFPKSYTTKYERIKFPQTLTPEVAAWLGALIADGTTSCGALVISAKKHWKRKFLQQWSQALFSGAYKAEPDGFAYSSQVREFVEYLYGSTLKGTTARYKRVPSTILRSPKKVQGAFLGSLLDFDGEISGGTGIIWSTASKRLARDVQMMLLNFGIFGTLSSYWSEKYKWHYYGLGVSGPRFDLYQKLIGTCRSVSKSPSRKSVSDICSIPFGLQMIKDELLSLRKRWGWSRNGKLSNGHRLPGLQVFCRDGVSATYDYFEKCVTRLAPYTSVEFKQKADVLLRKRFVFDKVIKKTIIRGPQIVSDVHVPEGHLFWGSGLINHNTLLAIEAAANFAKQYKGKIWYREAESAFDVPYAQSLGLPVKRVDFGLHGIDTLWDTIDDIFSDMEKCLAVLNKENTDYHTEMDKLRPKLKKARERMAPDPGLDKALEEIDGLMHPGLYIIDSLDALSTKDEIDRDRTKGTFGTQKAKVMSELFRNLVREFKYASMTILFLSQIRDRIGATFGVQYERAGGKSLDFYASHVVYLAHIATLTRTINGVKRATAVKIRAKCTKNKISTPFRECQFPISFGYGIDELGASVEWLQEVKKLDALGIELEAKPSKEEMDKKVQVYLKQCERMSDLDYQQRLVEVRTAVHQVWAEVEDGFRPQRSKYGNLE